MIWFGIASITPAILLCLGTLFGGIWPLLGLLSMTVMVFFFDKLASSGTPVDDNRDGHGLCYVLAVTHAALLVLMIWKVGGGNHLDLIDKIILITGAGLWFGQVSHSNAHELIHATKRKPNLLGKVLYASLFYGHHATAHVRVHHIHVATDADPNSARFGEHFWTFMARCAREEFLYGLRAENAARARKSVKPNWYTHPYMRDAVVGLAMVALAVFLSDWHGLLVLAILSLYAAWQLMLSDYVQHYGLRRKILETGKPEPVGPQHSWNAPRWYSSSMMLNAPRHSDHHLHPSKSYPALAIERETMPTLPQSLPVMAVIALVPPFWHRLMDRRVSKWVSPEETSEAPPKN